ncbi:enoyl-CoA hydratase [Tabrizicola oligotrophica]|uniref:Enoyl-CoA hydratase domain-containing protein 3, mitochondrial n=1 Tax=Tabrizicola oligotrophica TaxID=2710650 RepID=A0A6M0QYJ5_9RHOB|nr:enoyl-CoA hydratase [Tabrizicola oligotrophica]NEY92091.1 enoyl-CoA hydratase [Tabrizicola oligotrophica]
MTEPLLLRNDQAHIATLTLNSPLNFNALSDAMLLALSTEIARLAKDRTIRAVILKGAGKAFCAGHDLKEMQSHRADADKGAVYYQSLFAACAAMMQALQKLPQITIAQVHTIATAAGCQLAASCDMVVASHGTRFGVNGINIGLFCSTPMVALSRKVPPAVAFEMLSTGEFISAERAREVGLVNRVTAPEALETETRKLAETVAGKLAKASRIGKAAFYDQLPLTAAEAYALAGRAMVDNMLTPDTDEGISAFLEKRPPNWG